MKEISYEGPSFFEKGKEKKATRSRGSLAAPTVRTFRADVEELIEEKGTTKTQMVMAEAARREARGESRIQNSDTPHLGRIIFILLLVLTFGIGVGAYVLIGTKITEPEPIAEIEKPLSQRPIEIQISNSPREQIMADISISFGKTALAVGGVREVHFMTKPTDESARIATTEEILKAISFGAQSESLIRSLSDISTFGIFVERNALIGYLLLNTRSYSNSFSGMLDWENMMTKDLLPALSPWYPRKDIKNLEGRLFTDERIAGVDARVLRDIDGKVVLIYTFINRSGLLITAGEETFVIMIAREQVKIDTATAE